MRKREEKKTNAHVHPKFQNGAKATVTIATINFFANAYRMNYSDPHARMLEPSDKTFWIRAWIPMDKECI